MKQSIMPLFPSQMCELPSAATLSSTTRGGVPLQQE